MAGEVLLLNFCAVTNGSASIEHLCYKAATTPSPEPLAVMLWRHCKLETDYIKQTGNSTTIK